MFTGAEGSPATAVLTLPGNGRVERGGKVVLQCKLKTKMLNSISITWYRRSGDVEHKLAVEDSLKAQFGAADRVKITRNVLNNSLVSNLTISRKLTSLLSQDSVAT